MVFIVQLGGKPAPSLMVSSETEADHAGPSSIISKVKGGACGATASVIITERQGALLGWGREIYGELPTTTLEQVEPPSQPSSPPEERHQPLPSLASIVTPGRVSVVAMGPHHVLAGLEGGGLLAWGLNLRGQGLGLGHCGHCIACTAAAPSAAAAAPPPPPPAADPVPPTRRTAVVTPRRVPALEGRHVVALSTGEGHSLCVTAEGEMLSWGSGTSGQLGLGEPVAAGGGREMSTCHPTPVRWDGVADTVRQVAVGKGHSMLVTRKGRMATWGSGLYHQLGHGTTSNEWSPRVVESLEGVGEMTPGGTFSGIQAIACGGWHSMALSTTGELYAWGWNRFGQLGCTDRGLSPLPHLLPQVFLSSPQGTCADSTAMAAGRQQEVVFDQIGAGHRYTAAVSTKDKVIYYWGSLGLTPADTEGAGGGRQAPQPGPPLDAARGTALDLSVPCIKARSMEVTQQAGGGGLICLKGEASGDESGGHGVGGGGGGASSVAAVHGLACGPWELMVYGSRSAAIAHEKT